jgi:hypothetical protein
LGKQNHFNRMFKSKKEKFTYLVPSDQAWRNLHKSFATVHKILFMGDFAYQVSRQFFSEIGRRSILQNSISSENFFDKSFILKAVPPERGLAIALR